MKTKIFFYSFFCFIFGLPVSFAVQSDAPETEGGGGSGSGSGDSCSPSTVLSVSVTSNICDLNVNPNGCSGGVSCEIAVEAVALSTPITIYPGDGANFQIEELLPGDEVCSYNQQCISGQCQSRKCVDGGVCASCVAQGLTPSQGYSCCSGLTLNNTTGKCEYLPIVPSQPLAIVGTLNSNSCEFQYTEELQYYIDTYLDQHTKEMVAFLWLFGANKGEEIDEYIPEDANSISDSKIYGNRSDYYPFYDSSTYSKNGDGKVYSKSDLSSPKGLHDIAIALKTAYAGPLDDFIQTQNELLSNINKNSTNFENDQYRADSNAYVDATAVGGEYGTDYYQLLLDYYNAINERETALMTALSTSEADLSTFNDKVMGTLQTFNFDNDTYEPDQCHGGSDNDETIYQTMFKYNCVRATWQFRIGDGRGGERTDYFVDPVFRFSGKTLKNFVKHVALTHDGLTYEYQTYNPTWATLLGIGTAVVVGPLAGAVVGALSSEIMAANGQEGPFLSTITSDIYTQMAEASATARAMSTAGTTSSDAYLAQFYKTEVFNEDDTEEDVSLSSVSQVALLYFLAWNGHFDMETGDSSFASIANAQCGEQQGGNWGNQENDLADVLFSWNDNSQYPVKTRQSFISFNNGTTQGGLLYTISQLRWFYEQSKTARDETINCLASKITSMSSGGGNDYRGSTGASTYTNQETSSTKGDTTISSDCSPSNPGCGTSQVGLAKINLNLGTNAIVGGSDSNRSSVQSTTSSSGSMNSSSFNNGAIRSAQNQDAANTKAYGSKYTTAKGTVKGSETIKAAIKKLNSNVPIFSLTPKSSSNSGAGTSSSSAQATPSADASAVGAINSSNANSAKNGGSGWKGGRNNSYSNSSGQTAIENNTSGLSQSDVESILSASKDSKYNVSEDDELFTIISKRYVRSGYPALLKRKTQLPTVQEAQKKDQGGAKEVFEPWKQMMKKTAQ